MFECYAAKLQINQQFGITFSNIQLTMPEACP